MKVERSATANFSSPFSLLLHNRGWPALLDTIKENIELLHLPTCPSLRSVCATESNDVLQDKAHCHSTVMRFLTAEGLAM